MSWFQTGLSSLTGQLGNFTREVLTEGTEEIEDVATELKVTRNKLNESELICSTQKKELDQLKVFIDELGMQMESKELQIQSLSENFREIMAAKEKELVILKKRESENLEATHTIRKDSFTEVADDTEDVFLLQHKISNLQTRIQTLESELQRHQQKETTHRTEDGGFITDTSSEEMIPILEKKMNSMEREMSDQLDRHQHELASLQDSHRQNLASIKRNNANVVERFKERIQELERDLNERELSNDNKTSTDDTKIIFDDNDRRSLLEKLDYLEKKNAKLEFDSAQVHAVDRKKTELIESLMKESDTQREDIRVLSEKLQKEITAREDLYKEFQLLLEENQTLMTQLSTMKINHLSEKEELKKKLKESEERPKSDVTSAPGKSLDDFESMVIQLKKELMDAENARIVQSELSEEKIRSQEDRLASSDEQLQNMKEYSTRMEEEMKTKKSDFEAEKMFLRRNVSELEEQVESLAENLAECQKLKENTEAVLAMERRDREFGAIIDRDLLKQKNIELEKELEKVNSELRLSEESVAMLKSNLISAEEEAVRRGEEASNNLNEVKNSHKDKIEILKNEISKFKEISESRLAKSIENDDVEKDDVPLKPTESSDDDMLDEVETLRKDIKSLEQELEQAGSISTLYEAEVERLSKVEKEFENLKQQHETLKTNYEQLQNCKDDNMTPTIKKSDTSSSLGSDKSSPEFDSRNEISALKFTISKQEDLIKTLNGKYSNVFKMLEDRSLELFGNEKMLVRLNQLQAELDSTQKEREHMISILNDKTRESSNLKVEVHRLMEAMSAGKTAFSKLQNEVVAPTMSNATIATVSTGLPSNAVQRRDDDGERDDMKREAVKKLSQMIKDRDFEIDALNKKNETLLQVLQTDSSESLNHEIKRLLMERDTLKKQVSSFHLEKDQLINALNAKHTESLGYFDELNEQKKTVDELSAELERLSLSHRSMGQQLEDKQKNLIKLLDEHSVVRRKITSLEKRRKENYDDDDDDDETTADGDDDDDNKAMSKEARCSFTIGEDGDDNDDGDVGGKDASPIDGDDGGEEASKIKLEMEKPIKKTKRSSRKVNAENFGERNPVVMRMVEDMMREKEMIIMERQKTISDLQGKVLFFEAEMGKLHSKLASSENLVKQKESDVSLSKKHLESLNFKLHDETTKRSEVEKDLESIQMKLKTMSSEVGALKRSNTILASNVTQRDLELKSLKHELETMKRTSTMQNHHSPPIHTLSSTINLHHSTTDVRSDDEVATNSIETVSNDLQSTPPPTNVRSTSDDPTDVVATEIHNHAGSTPDSSKVEELEKMVDGMKMREAEFVRVMIHLQQERDQLYMAVCYHQNEAMEAKNSLSSLQDRETRLTKECERLRDHLLSMEEGYTREAVEAEEREKTLRNQLAAAQDKIATLTDSVLSNRTDLSKQTEQLQQQLHSIAEQRDNALLQLTSTQETLSSYSSSLSNLQMVLEQFQSERNNQQSLEVEKFQLAYNKKQIDCQQLQNQVQALLVQMEDHSEAIRAAQRLSEQMDKKEHLISALKEEVRLRELELKKTGSEIKKLTLSTEAKVDKVLLKSLLIGYFHAPASKRLEAFNVIGQILNFSSDELNNIGMSTSNSGGWIEGIFGKKSSSSPSLKNKQSSFDRSFSELFVSFLEKESTPNSSSLRLPTEKMITEQLQKKKQPDSNSDKQRNSLAFNPFSVPISIAPNLQQSRVQDPALLSGLGGPSPALFERSSPLLSSQITPASSTYFPSIVQPLEQGTSVKPHHSKDSIVPIVLAAAASSNPISFLYSNNNNNNNNNNNKRK